MRVVPLLLLAACGPARVPFTDDDACVRITSTALRFHATRIGVPEEREIDLANACDRDIEVRPQLSGSDAFSVAEWAAIPALDTVQLAVSFTAAGYSPENATLGIATFDVDLEGIASGDQDGDGHDAIAATGDDCDDGDASRHPGAVELRDLLDQDCDGLADDGLVRPGDLYVTELMVTPSVGPRWLELTNASSYDVELAGLRLAGDDGDELIMQPRVLAAGTSVVVGGSGPVADIVWTGFDLTTADTLALSHGDVALQYLEWTAGWGFAAGASLGLDPLVGTRANAGDARNWCASVTAMADGDHGTPRAANDACPHLDHDDDGWTPDDGDCDDALTDVHPGSVEVWNGLDDDCDGSVDHAVIADVASGFIDGGFETYLGAYAFGAGDLDADGQAELVLVTAASGGTAWLLEGAAMLHTGGSVSGHADAIITGTASSSVLRAAASRFGDVSGDGRPDLVLATQSTASEPTGDEAHLVVFADGPTIAGTLDIDAASLAVTGATGLADTVLTHMDLSGDGVAEIVTAGKHVFVNPSYVTYQGAVEVLDVSDISGVVAARDARRSSLEGDDDYDMAAHVAGGDVDGDGAIDLVVGAAEASEGYALATGSCSLVPNSAALSSDSVLSEAASARILGDKGQWLCNGMDVADIDGDGVSDIVASGSDGVYVFLGGASLSGNLTPSMASIILPTTHASWGTPVTTGDVDGDSAIDVIVGAGSVYGVGPLDGAAVHLGGDLRSGVTSAARSATAETEGDAFGGNVLAADLDGDGFDDLLLAASQHASRSGRLYLVEGE